MMCASGEDNAMSFATFRKTVRHLYEGATPEGVRFRNEEVIFAVTNLAVFIFVMTAIVYETQKFRNTQITNYADALYFTVTALTTTGFGDITLQGTTGRMITVVIMIFGVTLFFNLARALLTPHKVRFACPTCGT